MRHLTEMFDAVAERLRALARRNAVVARPVSVGDRHVITLCELSLGFGGGGGSGEGQEGDQGGAGTGAGGGGRASACPVAVLIVDGDKITLKELGK